MCRADLFAAQKRVRSHTILWIKKAVRACSSYKSGLVAYLEGAGSEITANYERQLPAAVSKTDILRGRDGRHGSGEKQHHGNTKYPPPPVRNARPPLSPASAGSFNHS